MSTAKEKGIRLPRGGEIKFLQMVQKGQVEVNTEQDGRIDGQTVKNYNYYVKLAKWVDAPLFFAKKIEGGNS